MHETHLYLTELVGLVVYDLKGKRIGRIRDAAIVPSEDPGRVDRYLIGGGGWSWLTFRHDQVHAIGLGGIHLRDEQLTPYHADDAHILRLVRDLLDQQIIDAQGRKVVRVTDVTFRVQDGRELAVMEVDIGLRSVFRRLVQGMPPQWVRKLQGPIPVHSIPWGFTNILEADPQRRLRLNINTRLLEEMHPADLADIVEELSPEDREAIIESMDSERAAEALSEVEPEIQASILESLETEKAADILEEMPADIAAGALAEMEAHTSAEILEEMEAEPKTEVAGLLELKDGTAGNLMSTGFVSLPEGATVASALAALRENEESVDRLNTLFLVNGGGTLRGVVPLSRILLAEQTAPLAGLAPEEPRHVYLDTPEDDVLEMFDKYNLLSLAVVDDDDVLAGVITVDDVITVLRRR